MQSFCNFIGMLKRWPVIALYIIKNPHAICQKVTIDFGIETLSVNKAYRAYFGNYFWFDYNQIDPISYPNIAIPFVIETQWIDDGTGFWFLKKNLDEMLDRVVSNAHFAYYLDNI
jgi:hypothetical protein